MPSRSRPKWHNACSTPFHLALRYGAQAASLQELVENVSTKVGAVLLILGGMHFFNLYVFSRMRRRALLQGAPPPLPPQGRVPVMG